MGNNQSCISEAEILTEAQPFGKKKNIFALPTDFSFADNNDNNDQHDYRQSVSRLHKEDSAAPDENRQMGTHQSNNATFDAVRVATLDSFSNMNPSRGFSNGSGAAYKMYDPRCRNIKGKMLVPWRKKKKSKPEPMETRGRSIKLDKHHGMVIFTPKQDSNQMTMKHNVADGESAYHDIHIESNELPTDSGNFNKEIRIRLLMKSAEEMRQEVSFKSKGRKHCFVDTSVVCGIQIFVTRYDALSMQTCVESKSSSDPQKIHTGAGTGYTKMMELEGMNVIKPTTISEDKIKDLISIFREKVYLPSDKAEQRIVSQNQEKKIYDLSGILGGDFSNVYSAFVPFGIGRQMFTPERLMNTVIDPVDDVICLDQENHVYVCDIGLTATQCDFIVDTTERCARGNYSAYTYAKQTLGCRDHDELAVLCEWPVMRAYASIMAHLERRFVKSLDDTRRNATTRQLVLDEREPHVVKYDTSKKERQKLDTHTDKSEWTFIIALCDGNGKDYDGGGTYLESIDATIHLQKGHALIFPGKQRHRGQKIINGIRFLLVGFLVDKDELDEKDGKKKDAE